MSQLLLALVVLAAFAFVFAGIMSNPNPIDPAEDDWWNPEV